MSQRNLVKNQKPLYGTLRTAFNCRAKPLQGPCYKQLLTWRETNSRFSGSQVRIFKKLTKMDRKQQSSNYYLIFAGDQHLPSLLSSNWSGMVSFHKKVFCHQISALPFTLGACQVSNSSKCAANALMLL